MPATPINVTQARRAVQYDGTNSADIAALIDDFTVLPTTTESVLNFTSNGVTLSVPRNGWLAYHQGMVIAEDVFANEDDFRDQYTDLASAGAHVHDLILTSGPGRAAEGEE